MDNWSNFCKNWTIVCWVKEELGWRYLIERKGDLCFRDGNDVDPLLPFQLKKPTYGGLKSIQLIPEWSTTLNVDLENWL